MMSSGCDRTSEMAAWWAWSCCQKDTHTQKSGYQVWSWRLFLCSQPDQLKQPDGRQRSNLTYYYQTQWLQWSPHSKTAATAGFASDAQQFKKQARLTCDCCCPACAQYQKEPAAQRNKHFDLVLDPRRPLHSHDAITAPDIHGLF